MVAIVCEDGTVLNCAHVVCLEVVKQGPDQWNVRARTLLDPEFSNRTIFHVESFTDEDEAKSFAVRALTGSPF